MKQGSLARGFALLTLSVAAAAQAPALTPQQRYEQQIAHCNSGQLPEPVRNACIRDAGLTLDKARGGPPGNVTSTSEDGRATIVSPADLPPPSSGSDEITSPDGRSTIVLPANQAR